MAEWSKAVDLRSTIFGCVGSNPTRRNYNLTEMSLNFSNHFLNKKKNKKMSQIHIVEFLKSISSVLLCIY